MEDKLGINLRALLCTAISLFKGNLKNYKERNTLIDEIEKRIQECDWLTFSDGTTFSKTSNLPEPAVLPITDNIFLRKFHAYELFGWFQHYFPGAFAISIYKSDSLQISQPLKEVWILRKHAYQTYHPDHRREYFFCPKPGFSEESTSNCFYIHIMIQDDYNNRYLLRWSYPLITRHKTYAATLLTLLINASLQIKSVPFHKGYDFSWVPNWKEAADKQLLKPTNNSQ